MPKTQILNIGANRTIAALCGIILGCCGNAPSIAQPETAVGNGWRPQVTYRQITGNPIGQDLVVKTGAWQKELSGLAARESATLFFVIGERHLNWFPPLMHTARPHGVAAMRTLCYATGHYWKQVGGVQVFTDLRTYPAPPENTPARLLAWINALDPAQRLLLTQQELPLRQIDPGIRSLITDIMWSGDPNMAFTVLDKKDEFSVRLYFDPTIETLDKATGKPRALPSVVQRPHLKSLPAHPASVATAEILPASERLDEPPASPGQFGTEIVAPLQFGMGTVLPLSELLAQASAVFEKPYSIPNSVPALSGAARVFVSGSYDRATFENVLAAATAPWQRPAPRVPDGADATASDVTASVEGRRLLASLLATEWKNLSGNPIDVSWLRAFVRPTTSVSKTINIEYGAQELIPTEEFLGDRSVKVATLTHGRPALADFLQEHQVAPDAVVTPRPGLSLVMGNGGAHKSASTANFSDGELRIGLATNQARLRLF